MAILIDETKRVLVQGIMDVKVGPAPAFS